MHLNLYLKGTKWWKHFKSKCCAMWTICLILSLFLTITTQITDNQLNESRFSTNATEFNTNPVETRSNKQESPSRKWKLTWKIAGIIFLISLSVLFSGIFQWRFTLDHFYKWIFNILEKKVLQKQTRLFSSFTGTLEPDSFEEKTMWLIFLATVALSILAWWINLSIWSWTNLRQINKSTLNTCKSEQIKKRSNLQSKTLK